MEAKAAKPKKKKKKSGKRGPKSKYDEKMHPHLIKHLCLRGMTNEEICKAIKISIDTLWRWRKKYPELSEALKTSKEILNSQVEQSLFRRTQGYDYEEVEIIAEQKKDGTTKPLRIKKTKKHVPADTGACAFWLKAQAGWREAQQSLDNDVLRPEDLAQMMAQVSSRMGGLFVNGISPAHENIDI
jgi:hypothetical protein